MDLSENEFRDLVLAELNACDVSTTSLKTLKKLLEERLNCDLTEKKDLIRDCLNQYVSEYEVVGEGNDDKPTAVMVKLSEEVIEFIGCRSEDTVMNRSDVVNTIWKYISDNRLQTDEKENNTIRCDEKLELLFQRKKLSSAKLTNLLEKMLTPIEDSNGNNDEQTVKKGSSKRSGGGFAKLVQLSDELTEFFNGVFEMQRTEVTKEMWVYIKANNLQNPSNKREILCDEKLEKLFKRKKVDMFKMTKLLSSMMKNYGELQAAAPIEHVAAGLKEYNKKRKRAEATKEKKKNNETSSSSKKKNAVAEKEDDDDGKEADEEGDVDDEDGIASAKKQKKAKTSSKKEGKGKSDDKDKKKKPHPGGLSKLMVVSEALKNILKCDDLAPRTEVVSKLWVYIREKDLQNPANKQQVFLDAPLKKAFNVDTCTIFSIHKLLSPHLTPP